MPLHGKGQINQTYKKERELTIQLPLLYGTSDNVHVFITIVFITVLMRKHRS